MPDLEPDSSRLKITRVRIENFRSIRSCDVRLGPLTVLVGPNASGKSNFLDAIRLIADFMREPAEDAVSRRGGMDALLHRSSDQSAAQSFYISLNLEEVGVEGVVTAQARYGIELSKGSDGEILIKDERFDSTGEWEDRSFHRKKTKDGGFEVEPIPFPAGVMDPRGVLLRFLGGYLQVNGYTDLREDLASMSFYDLDVKTLRELDQVQPHQRGNRLGTEASTSAM